MAKEHCLSCEHYDQNKGYCKRTFIMYIVLGDGHGSCKVDVIPGTIPEHLEAKVQAQLHTIITRFMDSAITKLPVWDEIREYQLQGGEERETCPAREAKRPKVQDYIKIVKFVP